VVADIAAEPFDLGAEQVPVRAVSGAGSAARSSLPVPLQVPARQHAQLAALAREHGVTSFTVI
jgi:hypothetical protein